MHTHAHARAHTFHHRTPVLPAASTACIWRTDDEATHGRADILVERIQQQQPHCPHEVGDALVLAHPPAEDHVQDVGGKTPLVRQLARGRGHVSREGPDVHATGNHAGKRPSRGRCKQAVRGRDAEEGLEGGSESLRKGRGGGQEAGGARRARGRARCCFRELETEALMPADKIEHELRGQDDALAPEHDACDDPLPGAIQAVRAVLCGDQARRRAPRGEPAAPRRDTRARVHKGHATLANDAAERQRRHDEHIERILGAQLWEIDVRATHELLCLGAARGRDVGLDAMRAQMRGHLDNTSLDAAQLHRRKNLKHDQTLGAGCASARVFATAFHRLSWLGAQGSALHPKPRVVKMVRSDRPGDP